MKRRIFMILFALYMVTVGVCGTVNAEESKNKVVDEDREFFDSVQELSVSEMCDMLESISTVKCVNAVEENVYYIQNDVLYCYDTVSDSLTTAYSGDISVGYYIPGESGVLIGTEAPADESGNSYTTLEAIPGLTWGGEYYYYSYKDGSVTAIEDPGLRLVTMTTKFHTVTYQVTINGVLIPLEEYPNSTSYFNGKYGNAYQCHGFGLYVLTQLYGSYQNTVENYTNVSDLTVADIVANYPLGTLIRAIKNDGTKHTMIYIGGNSSRLYVYHANWPDEGEADNIVHTAYISSEDFAGTFSSIYFMKYHTHAYTNISTYSTTKHKLSCVCGAAIYQTHTVTGWKYYSSSQHVGPCSVCSQNVYESHTLSSAGSCTKCTSSLAKVKIPMEYE